MMLLLLLMMMMMMMIIIIIIIIIPVNKINTKNWRMKYVLCGSKTQLK